MHNVSMMERRKCVDGIKDNIKKMEKMISSINESKVDSFESEANQRLLKLKREREKLDRERKKERAAIIIEKKITIGNAVISCFGEDIILSDTFFLLFLGFVKNNREKVIESIKKGTKI